MSNRTIVEFNHDLANEIDKDPDGFVRAISEMLNSGVNETECRRRRSLKKYGVTTTPTHRHSTEYHVILKAENGFGYYRRIRMT